VVSSYLVSCCSSSLSRIFPVQVKSIKTKCANKVNDIVYKGSPSAWVIHHLETSVTWVRNIDSYKQTLMSSPLCSDLTVTVPHNQYKVIILFADYFVEYGICKKGLLSECYVECSLSTAQVTAFTLC
jgi:hypothetical protein